MHCDYFLQIRPISNICFTIGGALVWRCFAIACCVFALIQSLLFSIVKESPQYLYFKNQQLEAVQALHWLRGEEVSVFCIREKKSCAIVTMF